MRAASDNEVVRAMDLMARDQLLQEVEPPLLPLQMALERGLLEHLAPQTLEVLLRGQHASMATGFPLTRLGEASWGRKHALVLLRALQKLRRPNAADKLEVSLACQRAWTEPLPRIRALVRSDRRRGIQPADLLASVWAIMLHAMARPSRISPEVLRRFTLRPGKSQ
jgi:hypothetical protein